ncbi:MAG TPA: hypothetical protein VGN34_07745 [Ktedonobacteraceae bacterium]
MRLCLLFLCRTALLATLGFWAWLLWRHPDPDLLSIPAGILSLVSPFLLDYPENPFEQTAKIGCCWLICLLAFHLTA